MKNCVKLIVNVLLFDRLLAIHEQSWRNKLVKWFIPSAQPVHIRLSFIPP